MHWDCLMKDFLDFEIVLILVNQWMWLINLVTNLFRHFINIDRRSEHHSCCHHTGNTSSIWPSPWAFLRICWINLNGWKAAALMEFHTVVRASISGWGYVCSGKYLFSTQHFWPLTIFHDLSEIRWGWWQYEWEYQNFVKHPSPMQILSIPWVHWHLYRIIIIFHV